MSIQVDYGLVAECNEEELLEKLHRIRTRLFCLPLKNVSPVRKIDPVYQQMFLMLIKQQGLPIPAPVLELIDPDRDDEDDEDLILTRAQMAIVEHAPFPKELMGRFRKPVIDFAMAPDLWNKDDYPEEVTVGLVITYSRPAMMVEFAKPLFCYGYAITIDIGYGCNPVDIALSTYRGQDSPLWLGWGYSKTQYASEFKQAHDTVCRVVDVVKDEGLILTVNDRTGYYTHRDWKRSMKIVNQELDFAWRASNVIHAGFDVLNKGGVEIEVIEDNIATIRPPWEADTSDYAGESESDDASKDMDDVPDNENAMDTEDMTGNGQGSSPSEASSDDKEETPPDAS